jgi:glycosyltransferase involved in cell wall biosynthesis
LLALGDVTVDKGARHLVEVYKTLERPPPLVMIGRCFLDELANDPQVTILGPWPHDLTQEALRRCLFAVAPSIWEEPFGLSALESAAASRAVVASDIGGLPEVVINGKTGLLVPPGDADALRTALNRLVSDGQLRERFGEAAVRHAGSFSADAVVPAFEKAYCMAIETRRKACGSSSRARAVTR